MRVILTSRTKDLFDNNITTLELSGIDDNFIYKYLEDTVSQRKVDLVKHNHILLETLRVPLFLTIFAEIENVDELLSRGEILDAFFTQTKEKLYTEQSNFLRIQREHLSLQANTAITLAMASFIYDFVIPEIAWEMVQKNSFQISETNIEAIIQKVLDGDGGKSPYCWAHGNDCFSEDYKGRFNESPNDVKQRFIDSFGEKNAPTNIRKFIIQQRAILVYDSKKDYEFRHQHIRDYFAALYHIKRLKLAIYVNEDPYINNYHLAREYLSEWKKPLPSQVLNFIGEILGEVHNIPQYTKEENKWVFEPKDDYIKRGLNIYRFKDESEKASLEYREKVGYAVWNLFQILKLVRRDLSGEDFSKLDLSICHANGFRLGNNTYSSSFDESILTDAFFAPSGHTAPVIDACFSPDNRYILTIDQDSTVKIWNAITHEVICTLPSYDIKIVSYCFHPSKNLFLLVNSTGIIKTFNYDEYSVSINHSHISRVSINNAQYVNNGECIFVSSNNNDFIVFDSETFEDITDTYGDVFKEKLSYVSFSPKANYILTIPVGNSDTSEFKIWSAKSNHKFLYSIQRPSGVVSAQFSPDEKNIIECYDWRLDKEPLIIDAKSTKLVASLNKRDCVQYSPLSGDYILATSYYGDYTVYDKHYNKVAQARNFSFAHFSLDEKYIITACNDSSARGCDVIIRDVTTLTEVPGGILKGYTERLNAAIFTPDSNHIITVSADGTTKAWTVGQPLKEISEGAFHEYTNNLRLIHYSTNGNRIVTVSNEGIIKVWDASTNEEIKSIKEDIYCSSAQLNPDGTRILITDKSCLFSEVLNAEPGKPTFEYEYESDSSIGPLLGSRDSNRTLSAEYSHDGKHIVTASFIGTVTIWDTSVLSNYQEFIGDHWDSFKNPVALSRKAKTTPSVSYVPNDETIVLLHEESNTWYLEIHEKESFKLLFIEDLKYATHNSVLAISPKSDYIATSLWDDQRNIGIVKLWTLDCLYEITNGTIEFSKQHIKSVHFSPNGKYLLVVTSQNDKESASVWSIKAEQSERVSVSRIQTIPNYPGLEVWNVDLQKINKHSDISNEMRKRLIEYGALINEKEAQHERTINDSEMTTHRLR